MTAVDLKRRRITIAPSRRGAVLVMAIVLLVAMSAAVAQVWTHLRAIEYGYKISRISGARDRMLEQNRRLRIELALLKSPDRVGRIAREELQLKPPEPEQIRKLRLRAVRSKKR